jgi:hypothetical protein
MAITISGSGITSANIADGTITTDDILASDVKNLKSGRKNLIINGGMQVAQRATTYSGTSLTYSTVDRYGGNAYNVGSFAFTEDQSTDAPAGFRYSRKFTFTTGSTTSSNSRSQGRYLVEGYDIDRLNWGTSDAKQVTLSFWVKSSVTGTHAVSLINGTETHSYVSNYSINTANTWERKTITIAGPTVGTWDNTNNIGIRLSWDFGSGSTYDAPSADAWNAGWYYRTSSSVRPSETTGATWQMTGVQLELGSVATDFEHRSYGEELALCQRYYCKIGQGAVGAIEGTTSVSTSMSFPVEMRSSPSVSIAAGGVFNIRYGASDKANASPTVVVATSRTSGVWVLIGGFPTLTGGTTVMARNSNANANFLACSSEL